MKTYYKERKAAGLCVACAKPSDNGVRCKPCSQYQYDYFTRRRIERASVGECTQCGKPHVGRFLMCLSCRTIGKGYYYKDGGRKKVVARQNRIALRDAAYNAYGGAFCNCCGETETCFLSIDHVNDDGGEHRKTPEFKRAGGIHGWLKRNNYPPDFQVLCMNCNKGKYLNGGVCPHKSNAMAMFNRASETTQCLQ